MRDGGDAGVDAEEGGDEEGGRGGELSGGATSVLFAVDGKGPTFATLAFGSSG